jgi:hypothetical protein
MTDAFAHPTGSTYKDITCWRARKPVASADHRDESLGVQPSGGLTVARGVDPCGGAVERSLSVVPEYGMRPVGLFETCDLSR